MPRATIGEVMRKVGGVVQSSASQLATGAAKTWLEEHRVELLETIQKAQTERGAELLHEFCRKVPLAAGLVAMAMNGSPDMAIAAIGMYDPKLGAEMNTHRENLVKLQEYWRRGAEQRNQQ